jgi:DNA-binding MarR family transcriptional regulator
MAKDPDPQRLALRCVEIGVLVRQALAEALLPYGVTPEQHEVLALLAAGMTSARELCEASGRDKTTLSRVLARAKLAGLLTEEKSESDRRRQVLRLTDKGAATVDQTGRLLDRAAPRLLDGLTAKDRRRLHKIIGKLRTHLSV